MVDIVDTLEWANFWTSMAVEKVDEVVHENGRSEDLDNALLLLEQVAEHIGIATERARIDKNNS